VTETEQERQWRREFENAGEQAVRDSLDFDRDIATGDAELEFAKQWLRDKEREREARARQTDWYLRWTFWVAVATLIAAVAAVVVPFFVRSS
jgi:hypothetical protein